MSEEAPKPRDDSQVKLIGIGDDQTVLSHVPGWYGEACCQGLIRKVAISDDRGKVLRYELQVKTPVKMEFCKVGDVIKNSLNGALFVRHFSQQTGEPA